MSELTNGLVPVATDRHLLKGADAPINFNFSYLGFLFAVRAEKGEDGKASELRFHAYLGNLPYTAEKGANRVNAMAIIRAAVRSRGGRFRFTQQQKILMMATLEIKEDLTPEVLVGTITRLILEVKPYLEMLAMVVNQPGLPVAAEPANDRAGAEEAA
ncbi:MAG: hypothetical protein ACPGNT_00260 [Rhodospirillales bacterium]